MLFAGCNDLTIDELHISNVANADFAGRRNDVMHFHDCPGLTIINVYVNGVRSTGFGSGDKGNRVFKLMGAMHGCTITRGTYIEAGRQPVQFANAFVDNGDLSYNAVFGRGPEDSDYEDMFNFYSSGGDTGAPLSIHHNLLSGGGPSLSGTGMILGDAGKGKRSSHLHASHNIAISTGAVGLSIAGGVGNRLTDNICFNLSPVTDPQSVGMMCKDFQYSGQPMRSAVMARNRVYWHNQHKHSGLNHHWIDKGANANLTRADNKFGDPTLVDLDLAWRNPADQTGTTHTTPPKDTPIVITPPAIPTKATVTVEALVSGTTGSEQFRTETHNEGIERHATTDEHWYNIADIAITDTPPLIVRFINDGPGRDLTVHALKVTQGNNHIEWRLADLDANFHTTGTYPHCGTRTHSNDLTRPTRGVLHCAGHLDLTPMLHTLLQDLQDITPPPTPPTTTQPPPDRLTDIAKDLNNLAQRLTAWANNTPPPTP